MRIPTDIQDSNVGVVDCMVVSTLDRRLGNAMNAHGILEGMD
jgi:hypothetical protein